APLFLIVAGYIGLFLKIQFQKRSVTSFYAEGYEPNLIGIIRSFGEYAKLIFWPTSLSPYYDFGPSLKQFNFGFVLSLLWCGLLIYWTRRGWKRKEIGAFGLAAYTISLLPVLNILPHPIWVADRYQYFAAPFLYGPVVDLMKKVSVHPRKILSTIFCFI